MTHEKNNTHMEIIVKRMVALREGFKFVKKKVSRKQGIMRDQTHKATKCNVVFAGWENIRSRTGEKSPD